MKIAFVGKGGAGKTTLAALVSSYFASQGRTVLAVDADINQNLAAALGVPSGEGAEVLPLGEYLTEIKEYLRGDNHRIASAAEMVKTTPPGRGSRLLRITEQNPIWERCLRGWGGVRLAVTGGFAESDLGVACYHSKVGAVELILNHLVDAPDEYVVVDMTAGADAFASGLFTRFDRTFVVCEPTMRSVGVYRQYLDYAREYDVALSVLGNKVGDAADRAFLEEEIGADLFACLGMSAHVRAAEQGCSRPIEDLEPFNVAVLQRMREEVECTVQDWERFTRQAVQFHLRNAEAWANAATGRDLAAQIDPDFVLGPATLAPSPT
ncbi:AAA family ATPase [Actinopolymorpha pittospori]|uniref:CO dehydrogenase maturation factor n=1 Tax=Actinopolymorpha pittospori TaxID=648752 RepID=A0A927MMJ2_9ACTN|nr:AAA family ATPase [Actinopolymorpha pittospori]MBE1603426.1 CO dehydrogenase maturation factor [Actinopolymorpha pittospori]